MYWLKLNYGLLDWEWYTDANTMRLFIHCLLKANRKKGRYKGHNIEPGSFVTGRKILAEELKLTEKQIRTALKHLKETMEVATLNCGQFSIVTVKNWEKYQDVGQIRGQEGARKGPGRGQEGATIRECKNKENEKNEEKPPIVPHDFFLEKEIYKSKDLTLQACRTETQLFSYVNRKLNAELRKDLIIQLQSILKRKQSPLTIEDITDMHMLIDDYIESLGQKAKPGNQLEDWQIEYNKLREEAMKIEYGQ